VFSFYRVKGDFDRIATHRFSADPTTIASLLFDVIADDFARLCRSINCGVVV
jgi:hypothetical protein